MPTISRRNFIQTTAAAAATTPLSGAFSESGTESTMRQSVAFWDGFNLGNPSIHIERMKKLGIRGVVLVTDKGWPQNELERGLAAIEAAGMFVAEVAFRRYHMLTSPAEKNRKRGMDTTLKVLSDAHFLKTHCLTVHWMDDENQEWCSSDTWRRLLTSTETVAAEAERLGVDMGFHSYCLGPWDSPEAHRQLCDKIKSPRVRVLLDPVNMFNHRNIHHPDDFLNHCFDILGDVIIGAHAKDVEIDTRHWIIKIDEVPPGEGRLNYELFLKRMAQLDNSTTLTIEHLRDVGVSGSTASPNVVYYDSDLENSRAKRYIDGTATRIGVTFN